jgi:hypothetical protein
MGNKSPEFDAILESIEKVVTKFLYKKLLA